MTPLELLATACDLADVADSLTMASFRQRLEVATKPDGSWLTQVDLDVEMALRSHIQERFPEHGIFGEEHGQLGRDRAIEWIIDPIDGTSNFVSGNPIFATLIAVQDAGREVAAVVSAPALGVRWTAAAQHGAWQDGRQIHVSTTKSLEDAELSLCDLRYLDDAGVLRQTLALSGHVRRQRGYGDFWQHCLVASGASDIALDADVKRWDLAAVKLVVEEAGGQLTTFDGTATSDGPTAVSTNGVLHSLVVEALGQ